MTSDPVALREPSRHHFAAIEFLDGATLAVLTVATGPAHPLTPNGFIVGPLALSLPVAVGGVVDVAELRDRVDMSLLLMAYTRTSPWEIVASRHVAWVDTEPALWPLPEYTLESLMAGCAP
ncbi:hypothetical protein ABIB15_002132 [Marisediminicola sp. UYEF4]|uniref:hypothetical protein n=1 Tax=Marisediminicola sp. UYEF4 TaxID=1756384 RepID=UPI0033987360